MITYSNVEVRFGDFVALPDFGLTVREGEFFTLLGPSGCGKSTALRTLAGFIQPSRGEIEVAGKRVTPLPSHRRNIGMVFQSYALFPALSVRENIAFGLKVAKIPAAEINERVSAIASDVSLTREQLTKNITELSGGQQQRVAIARALILKPKVLLLDEPLSNLDAKLRHHLRGQLKELQQQFGITTVYVTHDQDEALTMSDRIAVMNDGRIEQVGTPQEIYNRSASEFVCTFVGHANRLDATVLDDAAGGDLMFDGGTRLDRSAPAYVRVEKVRMQASRWSTAPATAVLPGTIRSRQFHGLYSSYRVETAAGLVRTVMREDGSAGLGVGDTVELSIDGRDVLQYGRSL